MVDEGSRLEDIARRLGLTFADDGCDRHLLEPNRLADSLRASGAGAVVAGPLNARVVVARSGRQVSDGWTVANLSGEPLARYAWPAWARDGVIPEDPDAWISAAAVTDVAWSRFSRPHVLLAGLYHQEHFPLPRFALGISNLAHAARSTRSGEVRLLDMQLGVTLEEIAAASNAFPADIIGVSATFGQYDQLVELLERLDLADSTHTIVVGGSLAARIERLLLDRFPNILVAHGAGESVLIDLISRYHGDMTLGQVRGIAYRQARHRDGSTALITKHNARPVNRLSSDTTPELDLLRPTLAKGGVAQLEASRGCTNYCSFCPRGHKGTWVSAPEATLSPVLTAMNDVFDDFPNTARTMYLVDEEFIGGEPGSEERAIAIARGLHSMGYSWESSCRVDQIVDPSRNRDWHVRRAEMWRTLNETGLRRMLFGIESGVTSTLERFNKDTTGPQNALAIRTLSALGVPTRYTYITFDHLMTLDELVESCDFQSRTDLILRPLPHLTTDEIVDGVHDDDFVARHAAGRSLYTGISYMMVSMECLIGAPYTRRVAEAGLAGDAEPQMGRVRASYRDWRIGQASDATQRWVDRNFALDYALKSYEKVLEGSARDRVHLVRVELRSAAFCLLQQVVSLLRRFPLGEPDTQALREDLWTVMDEGWERLATKLTPMLMSVATILPTPLAQHLRSQTDTWISSTGWGLINSGDSC